VNIYSLEDEEFNQKRMEWNLEVFLIIKAHKGERERDITSSPLLRLNSPAGVPNLKS